MVLMVCKYERRYTGQEETANIIFSSPVNARKGFHARRGENGFPLSRE